MEILHQRFYTGTGKSMIVHWSDTIRSFRPGRHTASALWWVLLVGMISSETASAYTRVYLTNNTGQRAFSLRVKLTQPAADNSALAGFPAPLFQQAKVVQGGLELDFSLPLDPLGIADGVQVPIGWVDLDSQFAAGVEWFYWADASGNRVGEIQRPTTSAGGLNPPTGGALTGPGGSDGPVLGLSGNLPPLTETAAPEPGTMALLAGALLLTVSLRFRPASRREC
jgi:hypothetical protein